MSSQALVTWQTNRSNGLDRLVNAHHAVAGRGPGRRWLTGEINHALLVRLASEFQGFCRDLHDESIDIFIARQVADPQTASIVRMLLSSGRKLDAGNANWANVCADFQKFGLNPADDLRAKYPTKYPTWVQRLDRLNKARNAIAHDDQVKLDQCTTEQPLDLRTFRQWRNTCNAIAVGLDTVVNAYLEDLTGTPAW